MNKYTSIIALALFCAAALAGGAYFLWQGNYLILGGNISAQPQNETPTDIYYKLKVTNSAFAEGVRSLDAGSYTDAAKQFQIALAQTNDPGEEVVIKFWLGTADGVVGDYADTIAILKDIARDTTAYTPRMRATAVARLGHMFYRFGDPKITEEIFKDEPYTSMVEEGKVDLSYRHLFAYATTIYPVAIAELYDARWYAAQLVTPPPGGLSTTTEATHKKNIRQRIQRADEDILRIRDDPGERLTFLDTLEVRAATLGRMMRAGDTSFGDPEAEFKRLLNLFPAFHVERDGTARLQYAIFVARVYGTSRTSDVQDILAPLYEDPAHRGKAIVPILQGGRDNTWNTLGQKSNLVLLSSLDPKFKAYLQTLGWSDADFE